MKSRSLIIALPLLLIGLATSQARAATEPPVPVRTVSPTCPQNLRDTGGIVVLKCAIDDKGDVADVSVVKSTSPDLESPAVEAVKKWKFKPAQKDGQAVGLTVQLPIKFNTQG